MAGELVMAFDYGTTKIGIAVGQAVTGTATPLAVVAARDGVPDWIAIQKLIDEWKPATLVIGLPLNMDGSESEMSARAARFARQLTGRFNIPHVTWDERLTSREAAEWAGPDEQVDAIAARLVLESWFRESPNDA